MFVRADICLCVDMHAVHGSHVTVPCRKTENINMLSLQQGASHQENNAARHTLCQPKRIVSNTPAKPTKKGKGRVHPHRVE